jgi:hypothetical protein
MPLRGGTNLRCSATPKGARDLVAAAGKQLLELTACNSTIAFDTNEDPRLFRGIRWGRDQAATLANFFSCARLA